MSQPAMTLTTCEDELNVIITALVRHAQSLSADLYLSQSMWESAKAQAPEAGFISLKEHNQAIAATLRESVPLADHQNLQDAFKALEEKYKSLRTAVDDRATAHNQEAVTVEHIRKQDKQIVELKKQIQYETDLRIRAETSANKLEGQLAFEKRQYAELRAASKKWAKFYLSTQGCTNLGELLRITGMCIQYIDDCLKKPPGKITVFDPCIDVDNSKAYAQQIAEENPDGQT